jgi:hypothetical protein
MVKNAIAIVEFLLTRQKNPPSMLWQVRHREKQFAGTKWVHAQTNSRNSM